MPLFLRFPQSYSIDIIGIGEKETLVFAGNKAGTPLPDFVLRSELFSQIGCPDVNKP